MAPPPRTTLGQDDYDRALSAFKTHGACFAAVARACRISRDSARKLWAHGLPRRGLRPIKDALAARHFAVDAAETIQTLMARIRARVSEADSSTDMSVEIRALERLTLCAVRLGLCEQAAEPHGPHDDDLDTMSVEEIHQSMREMKDWFVRTDFEARKGAECPPREPARNTT